MRNATYMVIRSAQEEDAPAIAQLVTRLAERFITCDFGTEGRANFLASVDESSIRRLLSQDCSYFVAEDAARIIGVVGIRARSHLYHLFVDESRQGIGVGRKLWLHAVSNVVPTDYDGFLTVNSSRNAVGFYEKLGFVRTGRIDERGGVISVPMRLSAPAA